LRLGSEFAGHKGLADDVGLADVRKETAICKASNEQDREVG